MLRWDVGVGNAHPAPPRTPLRAVVAVLCAYLVLLVLLVLVAGATVGPERIKALTFNGGGVATTSRLLLGRPDGTDFLIDYVGLEAMLAGDDAYGVTQALGAKYAVPWEVMTANPHPPTVLFLLLPFATLDYTTGMSAFGLSMLLALVLTLRFSGTSWPSSIVIGALLGFTFPGAYGVSNILPLIGLGAAVAWRWRNDPLVAGLGIALAAAPKATGLVLAVPFLLAARYHAVLVAAGAWLVTAAVPVLYQPDIWSRWLDDGVLAATLNAARVDNASLGNLAGRAGLPAAAAYLIVGVLLVGAAVLLRNTFWPALWATVALLPIAWIYSLLTLVPLVVWLVPRVPRAVLLLVAAAVGAAVASPPGGLWPVTVFPVVVGLVFVAMLGARSAAAAEGFWLEGMAASLVERVKLGRASDGVRPVAVPG